MRKRDTSRNKTSLNSACFSHYLFVYSERIKVGENWVAWDPYKFRIHMKICEKNCIRGSADKSLTQRRRKQATATKLENYSTYSPRSSIHLLACCS